MMPVMGRVMKICNKCGFHGDDSLFRKHKNECHKCRYFQEYLRKYKNGYYFKKCQKHGILNIDQIIIVQRKDRGKHQVMLRCSVCFDDWHKKNIKNESLMKERIELNALITCKRCKVSYENKFFIKSELKKTSSTCKKCQRKYYDNYENNVSISRKFTYTRTQYNQLWEKQKGLCAICGLPESSKENGKTRRLSTDHCHYIQEKTGRTIVRGLLCTQCNTGLGRFKDDPHLLLKAADYIRRFNEEITPVST